MSSKHDSLVDIEAMNERESSDLNQHSDHRENLNKIMISAGPLLNQTPDLNGEFTPDYKSNQNNDMADFAGYSKEALN